MFLSETREVPYQAPENQILSQSIFGFLQSDIPNLHLNTLLNQLPNSFFHYASHQSSPPSSHFPNSNSTSDEADEYQLNQIDIERKQRRMISNRESARRSRLRKQKHLDELWSQVVRLRTENHNLIDKLNHVTESHDRILQENARLKEEASDLCLLLADLQFGTSFSSTMRDFDEDLCNIPQLSDDESSKQSLDMLLK